MPSHDANRPLVTREGFSVFVSHKRRRDLKCKTIFCNSSQVAPDKKLISTYHPCKGCFFVNATYKHALAGKIPLQKVGLCIPHDLGKLCYAHWLDLVRIAGPVCLL